jgi:hypothetical protein
MYHYAIFPAYEDGDTGDAVAEGRGCRHDVAHAVTQALTDFESGGLDSHAAEDGHESVTRLEVTVTLA